MPPLSKEDAAKLAGTLALGPLDSIMAVVSLANNLLNFYNEMSTKIDKEALAKWVKEAQDATKAAKEAETPEEKSAAVDAIIDVMKGLG